MDRHEFIADATRAAVARSRHSGFPPGITVAQAALESNWGQSRLARDAHNYFGIKAHGDHPRVEYPTREHVGGREERIIAQFAAYASMEDCFADRDRILLTAPCYAETRACSGNPDSFARALAKHWATDPEYAEKLLCVYRDNRLGELDFVHPTAQSPDSAPGHPPSDS
jgi:flagellar protein FlgJ